VKVHCEAEGGTGLAFEKGYNNAPTHYNCYSFAVNFSNKSILKACERVGRSLTCPNYGNYSIKILNTKIFQNTVILFINV